MRIDGVLQPATFIRRLNRFAALVAIDGREELAHVPNSGRLRELFVPGYPALVRHQPRPRGKTQYDLLLISVNGGWVSADARLPNALVAEALAAGSLPQFRGYAGFRREVTYGESRLDFCLGGRCYLEIKSVTLVQEGTGLFPDAPTIRGARHLRSLVRAMEEGHQAAVIFVIQREDASCFAPNDAADPNFGRALREAVAKGVALYAYTCRVLAREIALDRPVPVHL